MSTPILPFAMWESGTNQNSVPANDNSLRNQILNGLIISDSTDAQPALVSPGDDGKAYIMTGAATGAQWALFDQFDLAIFDSGTWYAFAPVTGVCVNIAGVLSQWSGSAYVAIAGLPDAPSDGTTYGRKDGAWVAAGGGAVSSVNGQTGAVVLGANDIAEPLSALSISSGVVNIDCALGSYFTLAMTANVTSVTFSNLPASGYAQTITVRLKQDGTGNWTIVFPASFDWAAGSVPTLSTAANAKDMLAITTFDQGTTWEAVLSKAHA